MREIELYSYIVSKCFCKFFAIASNAGMISITFFCSHLLNLYLNIFTFPYFFSISFSLTTLYPATSVLIIHTCFFLTITRSLFELKVYQLYFESPTTFSILWFSLFFLLLINYKSTPMTINQGCYLIVSFKTLYFFSLPFTYYSLFHKQIYCFDIPISPILAFISFIYHQELKMYIGLCFLLYLQSKD